MGDAGDTAKVEDGEMETRRTRIPTTLVAMAMGLLAAAGPAVAQGPPPGDELQWSLGLGVISAPRPYVGASNQTRVIPLLELSWKRFYFQGIRAGYRLVEGDSASLDVRARMRFAGFEEDDSPFLRGMEERQETVDAGLGLEWRVGQLELDLGVFTDVLGRSDGVEAQLGLAWPKIYRRGQVGFIPRLGVAWQNADFVDYYAGVRPDEAEPWRPAYEGRAALNAEAGALVFYRFTPRVRGLVMLQAQRLANEYEDSPIIDDQWGYFALVGATYSF